MTFRSYARAAGAITGTLLAMFACGGGQPPNQSSSAPPCASVAGLPGVVNDKGTASVASTKPVTVDDEYFSPTCLTSPSGTVVLTLHNRGHLLHNFSVPEQGIDVDIPPGQTVTVKVSVADKSVPFFCKYHRDAGQQGALLPSA